MRDGCRQRAVLWYCAMWCGVLAAVASGPPGAAETPCPPWPAVAQQQVTRAEIPPALERVLMQHQGKGWLAQFTEEKKVLILQRPLRASGELIFLPSRGLYRKLTTPFAQELLITTTALHQRDHSGRRETLALEKSPIAKALIEGFLTVFSGTWESLQAHFQGYFSSDNVQWRLGLKPIRTVMAQMISCIILEGEAERVVRLLVIETNGDVTRDDFFAPQILIPEQWGDYQHYFEWGIDTRQ